APHGAPKIRDSDDAKQTKACVDALFDAIQPDYLMILGAPDVVCHQPLDNPIFDDDDPDVPSDLPYACAASFSTDIADFVGPTRVVGRLPDVVGESDPAALLSALDTAIAWKRRSRNSYNSCCGISTDSWKGSTRKSTKKIFGSTKVKFISPPSGAPWSKTELGPRIHFINCHGLDFDTSFYGDDGAGAQPPAIDQADYVGRLREGTLMAAECCFGAMLYAAPLFSIQPGICNTAMVNGVYGFLGSTNVAYGPANSTGYADLVCSHFIINVRNGASIGRALLEARQTYASGEAPLDPVDLKTLAQFYLLGDPSIHPVKMPGKVKKKMVARKSVATTVARRRFLSRKGLRIGRSIAHVQARPDRVGDGEVTASLVARLPSGYLSQVGKTLSFDIRAAKQPALAKSKSALKKAQGGGRYYLVGAVDERTKRPPPRVQAKSAQRRPGPDLLMLALEVDSKIEYVKTLYRR
ncbi:MAG TPA: hypothetical protein VIV14_00715, partial [Gammaproteobacteria bacterium]